MQKRHVEMKIGGEIYSLRTDESDEEIRKLENVMNDKFNEIKGRNPGLSNEKLLLLLALEIGRENIEIREEVLAFVNKYEKKITDYSILKKET
ncbi:MAG: hypothetical protein DRP50_04300 [Thermotoga sp.]|nr:MAG: hypothetical protein DRP50_04300 [Thermotoga sp.]